MLDSDIIYVKNEYGEEQAMHLLFFFHLDEYEQDYVIFEDQDQEEIFVAKAMSDNTYEAISDEDELACVYEIADTLLTLEE